jgi:hypothetical protein
VAPWSSILPSMFSTAALDGDTADVRDQCLEPATAQCEEWTKVGLDLELVGVNCERQRFMTDTKCQKNPCERPDT